MENKIKEGDKFTIRCQETLIKEVELIIGEDITLEDAKELSLIIDENEDIYDYDEGYDLLQSLMDDSSVIGDFGFNDVIYNIETINKK